MSESNQEKRASMGEGEDEEEFEGVTKGSSAGNPLARSCARILAHTISSHRKITSIFYIFITSKTFQRSGRPEKPIY